MSDTKRQIINIQYAIDDAAREIAKLERQPKSFARYFLEGLAMGVVLLIGAEISGQNIWSILVWAWAGYIFATLTR